MPSDSSEEESDTDSVESESSSSDSFCYASESEVPKPLPLSSQELMATTVGFDANYALDKPGRGEEAYQSSTI